MPTVFTCLDERESHPGLDREIRRGWWLTDFPIRQLVAVDADGQAHGVWLGDARPDLTAAFPAQPHAARAGYVFLAAATPATAQGHWWFRDEHDQWWTCPADWRASGIRPTEALRADAPAPVASAGRGVEDRLRTALARGAGLTLRLDLINKCNLRCIMCHYSQDEVFRRPTQLVTPEQFRTQFDELAPLVGEIILSCADEPLASKHFPEIVSYVRRVRPDITIRFCTNAMLMTAPLRRVIVEQRVDHVLFSIDAVRAATLEGIRIGSRFARIVSHIRALRELRDRAGVAEPQLTVNFVMMVRNIHEAPLFVTLARRLGFSYIDFRHVVECFAEFDLFAEQLSTQPARWNYYREQIIAAAQREHISFYLPPALPTTDTWTPGPDEPAADLADFEAALAAFTPDDAAPALAPRSTPPPAPETLAEVFGHTYCLRPFSEVVIRQQDDVMPCPWHRTALGQLSATPQLSAHFWGERFRELREAMLDPQGHPNCRGCPLKSEELPSARHDN